MGAAGDMLTAALLELLPDRESILRTLNELHIPNVTYEAKSVVKSGITGTQMHVLVDGVQEGHHHEHHHHHSGLHEIEHILSHMKVSEKVKQDAAKVYQLIAEAESQVHNEPVTQIHFHEVGMLDAVADVVAVCYLMEQLGAEKVVVSPIHVGSGQVRCAHGVLPVPAPATAYILKDVPIYGGQIEGELCTPTGAALIKYYADEFGPMPIMKVKEIGYGMGSKDFSQVNCLRAMLGVTSEQMHKRIELDCNMDDMTGEEIAYAMERLFEAGVNEVFTSPVGMKKSRPGVNLTVICEENKKEMILETIFQHTTTIGVREKSIKRYVLERTITQEQTKYGPIRCKESHGYGISKKKYEFDDVADVAQKEGKTIREIREELRRNQDDLQ
ncbi:hypothetical protein SAMN02910417_02427 [Eubacterium oxidoreducens]|uniref:Pyridinium-3,5-bisthiocarboxylic acid mononucleotide nickel insertion protein n=2 Tax=Eubacterium oxidoreducens TaxID=1732 RepID=A0A1G6CIQ7_EUBOX|nr:hypothetical protein SAMN02910417_02427 [Eubacterium oxidoreducens]